METQQILFTGKKTAELKKETISPPGINQVLVKMDYTAISAGTEKANLLATPNRGDIVEALPEEKAFPIQCGYSGVGTVLQVGENVHDLIPGQKVATAWGHHAACQIFDRRNIVPIDQEGIDLRAAAFAMILEISLGGVRKTHPEMGESILVMGQGIIGVFATAFARICGGCPVIAADPNPNRTDLAKQVGANLTADPSKPDFPQRIHDFTRGKGANIVIEATGIDSALGQALDCVARQGRISLLGCTRFQDSSINFYQKVHRTGVSIIGAHTMVKPDYDSYPGYWTCADDMRTALDYIADGRLNMVPFLQHVFPPEKAPEVFRALCDDPDFPMGVLFDWRNVQ